MFVLCIKYGKTPANDKYVILNVKSVEAAYLPAGELLGIPAKLPEDVDLDVCQEIHLGTPFMIEE
jgi:hypothetical protein